ncbi:lipopolysaccharide biosynthesis protein [Roseivirga sp. E12]|uniref:lipopolysaccharide biosynthesis protein n=1 Tax=Roseivirga sp. E12 TaxID=2819237 RepID=UPI001ABCDD3A|nr:lipopolysaccharide biosynthesis protein [Roseivirga sp. E12]
MGIVIKQSIRSSIIAYIGVAVGYINVLWLYPYFLTTEQVGLFRLIQSSAFLLATFGQVGLGQSLVKFFPEQKNNKGFLTSILIGGLLGFILLCSLTLVFRESIVSYFSKESALFVDYFQVTLLVSFLIIQFQLLESYSRSLLQIVVPTFLRDIGLRVLTTTALLSYGFELIEFETLIYSLIAIYGLVWFGLGISLKIKGQLHLKGDFQFLKSGVWKRVLNFGFFSLIGAGGTQIILQIDSIMISGTIGLEATGIYTIAFFIGVVIEMPKRAITQISSALLSQSFNKGDMKAVKKLYQQTSINQMIIGTLLFIGVWANLENIYQFIPNKESYLGGFNVVLFIALGKLSDMAFGTNGEIIVMSKYYRFNVVTVSILAMLTISFNLWLIPEYGIEGAAIASFLSMLLFNVIKYIFVFAKFGIQPFTRSSIVFVIIAAFTLLVNYFLPSISNIYLDIMVRSLAIVIVLMGLTFGLKVSSELNQLLSTTLSRVISKR